MVTRIPRVLFSYACGRSLVCCRAPWRATVGADEPSAIEERLPEELGVRFRQAMVVRRGLTVVQQPGGSCALLAADPGCALQEAGGLDALPLACRNFPRLVTRTPEGVEVGFTLACPTAAALVVRTPESFAWAEDADRPFPYPPTRSCDDRVAWSRASDLSFGELGQLRRAWWSILDGEQNVVDVLRALLEAPGEPAARPSGPVPAPPLEPSALRSVTEAVVALPERGALYHTNLRTIWRGANHPPAAELPAGASRALACVAGLRLQLAGVHDGLPAALGMGLAARQTLQAVALAEVLGAFPGVGPDEALIDAVVATSRTP